MFLIQIGSHDISNWNFFLHYESNTLLSYIKLKYVSAEQLNFVIELRKFIQDLILVLLIDSRKVDNCMSAMLSKYRITRPNMPQSEQMASLQSSQ